MDYSRMSDAEINTFIAGIQFPESQVMTPYKHRPDAYIYHKNGCYEHKDYCNNPADAWPSIIGALIGVEPIYRGGVEWLAHAGDDSQFRCTDKNPLRAAMVVFLMMQDQ